MLLVPPTEEQTFNVDHRVILHGVSWKTYEAILAARGDRSAPRIAYLEGELEIMSPSEGHEDIKKKWARLLEAWCEEMGIPLQGYGSWTLKRQKEERGVEPDECYIVGRRHAKAPDLALEVIWSHGGLDKLEIYRRLGVREVQLWEASHISVFVLRGEGYVRVERSEVLPALDLELIARCLKMRWQDQAVSSLRKALRRRRKTH
ncbi:MAG: Uma2 family endonuclease [Myxococcales bacterium]|nr:Uma2 family endonuclease [Myxococcales bacterium]